MGNIGKSSSGCSLCRKRKIKASSSFLAPPFTDMISVTRGGPDADVLQVRSNRASSDTTLVDSGQASSSTSSRTYDNREVLYARREWKDGHIKAEETTSGLYLQTSRSTRTISPPPRYDIQHQSLCFFLNLFCFQAGRLYSFPVLDFLPDLIQKSDPESGIYQAATAVSRLALADRYSGHDIRLQTGGDYGRALSLTNATIRKTAGDIRDETVLAVWLLGLYEHISVLLSHGKRRDDVKDAEEEWQSHLSHVRGAMHLLHLRGMSQFTNPRSEKIFRIFKAAIQMRLFILTPVRYKDFDELEIDIFKEENEFVPSETANKSTAYFHRVARLMEKIRAFLSQQNANRPNQTATGEELLHYGESLDEVMTGWSKDEPGWDIMRVRSRTASTMWSLYPSHAQFYFYSPWVYLYWIRFLSARVKLYEGLIEVQTILTARKMHAEKVNLKISKYQHIIQTTASELIGLTAYALGDVTHLGTLNSSVSGLDTRSGFQEVNAVAAMQLVIPLKMLQRSDYPTAAQKGRVDLALVHIGDGFRRQPRTMV
ncbi:hypothetical protein H2204_005176 [Knufia peltigerae]|uniref:Uncharacterized protein n=1 Tax=Knufia peltigerae TaxID=1002370 RepID=A0AA38Y645_9EURO|nr:hypothetical protein H2204_005176 [Knufia peltigerae]